MSKIAKHDPLYHKNKTALSKSGFGETVQAKKAHAHEWFVELLLGVLGLFLNRYRPRP